MKVYVLSSVDFSFSNGDVIKNIIGVFSSQDKAIQSLSEIKDRELEEYRPIIINDSEIENNEDTDDNRICCRMETSETHLLLDFSEDLCSMSDYLEYTIDEKEVL